MPPPVILINATGGSDTTSSGAGPGTAISGSTGRTRNTASQLRVGLFGATDDLSGVATDGTHTLYIAIATAAARNHSSISAVKNTRHIDIGSITSGTAVLSAIVSTSGWAVGDVLSVVGAGAASATLYSTILTVDSAVQVTLNDNAGTTVVAAVVENPKQVSLTSGEGLNTGATDTAWAIGGVRASIGGTNSRKLIANNASNGDAMPGWVIELQSGHAESISAALDVYRAGNTTSGPITLRGASGAATLPKITATSAINIIVPRGALQLYKDFELVAGAASMTSGITDAGTNCTIDGIKLSRTSTFTFTTGISLSIDSKVLNCEIQRCATGILLNSEAASAHHNYIHDCTSHGINSQALDLGPYLAYNIIYACGGDGIRSAYAGASARSLNIIGNTIDSCTSDGIEITGAVGAGWNNLRILNNILSNNGGYGLNFSGASVTDNALAAYNTLVLGNNTYTNTSGAYKSATAGYAYNTCPWASGDPGLNPTYTAASSGNFSLGTNLKAQGYPLAGTRYVGKTSITYSYIDPGAAQREEPAGGGISLINRRDNSLMVR